MEKVIKIDGMSCAHCTARVENTLKDIIGITKVMVDLDSNLAKVLMSDEVPDAVISDAIFDAGFDMLSIETV